MPDSTVRVVMFSKAWCPYCAAARNLLKNKGVEFEEIDISGRPELREQMILDSNGRTTVPQVFAGQQHLGGFDDISALDRDGQLDGLLGIQTNSDQESPNP